MKVIDNTAIVLALLESRQDRALEDCGARAVSYAKSICPVDTGRLRASITHRVSGDTAVIGTDVEYATDVELGTGIYRPGGRKMPWLWRDKQGKLHLTHGQRPQPYLRPAMADHGEDYAQIIRQSLQA